MKEIGFPSPFIDIMMLRPSLRTVHTALWKAGSVASMTRAGEAEIAHQLDELLEAAQIVVGVVAGEFGEEDRLRLALDEAVDGRAEHRVVARQLDHRAVDQLDRRRAQLDDVLGRVHRLVEAREMADAEDPVRRDRLEVELDLGEEGEGAFASRPADGPCCGPRRKSCRCCSRRPGAAASGSGASISSASRRCSARMSRTRSR